MKFNKKITNLLIIAISTIALSACSTAKKTGVTSGDVYTGNDTVEYLATGVKDRVFFATNSSSLTTASRDTLRKQASYLRKTKKLNVVLEGHADERGTREYNLALGEKRANSAKDYLMTYGISGKRISVISYGKEKPVNSGSTPLAWSQNRRSVTIKAK
ncbi:peptidoglycan-associated lipoprotein Pal [Pelagibacteraceae bacterium]|jgi:peptidoglycan-associated lipoprotein|nr:peptidoglycan-associated lipoprotein Pal [Pelagibacteraceae bacterium]